MEAARKRFLRSGREYDRLFPKVGNTTQTILKEAGVSDTCAFIPKVVNQYLDQTKAISQKLKGATTYDTCKRVWHFVYGHIAYRKDKDGYEQIRSPARTWHDRASGVDCDCYTTFISSILTNLGIPHSLRITKYKHNYFQHIYPIVPTKNGDYITIDCVTDQFDYEVPYSEKKDYKMELQFLNGIGFIGGMGATQDYDLNGGDGVLELGRVAKKKKAASGGQTKKQAKQVKKQQKKATRQAKKADPNRKKGIKKLLNKVNKVNPATVALRNGVLAAMKLNIAKLGSRLRWSYLPADQAAKNNIDPAKYKQLLAVRQKLENIFYNAGGKPENLRKAVINGKGNKDKAVHGFGDFNVMELSGLDYVDVHSPLSDVLGRDIFHSENIEGMEGFSGFGQLGEPVTLATVAAASGVIATIAGMLKKIGDIFKGKGKGSDDFSEEANEQADKEVAATDSTSKEVAQSGDSASTSMMVSSAGGNTESAASSSSAMQPSSQSSSSYSSNSESSGNSGGDEGGSSDSAIAKISPSAPPANSQDEDKNKEGDPAQSFWEKHKKWLLPVSIGVGGLTVVAIGASMMKKSPSAAKKGNAMNGIPKAANRKKNHHRKKPVKHGKIKKVALGN
jgi:hypothetical protein